DLGCRVQRLMRLEGAAWSPVARWRALLVRSIGPVTIAATLILCTAWAVPRELTKGDSMITMKRNWRRALATIATLAAIQTPAVAGAQDNPPPTAAQAAPVGVAPSAALPRVQHPPAPAGELAQ